ncbi:MAG: TolC family protein [Ignavibacteriae bacterium]|nr:TolC family protein [Ignavibacteriota bacterium]
MAFSQVDSIVIPESEMLDLQFLTVEALLNNPDIQAFLYQMDVMEAKVSQARALDDPELRYMRMEMPGFLWRQAKYSNFELMQMLRFPTKLATQGKLAEIRAEHAHHDHLEKINEVLARLKSAYYELWIVQQNIVLNQENARLIKQFVEIARTKYAVGETSQQDVLKAQVELAMIHNELITLRQQELSAKAMLMAILNRAPNDTLGLAIIPEEVISPAPLDSLLHFALLNRSMLKHDSLSIDESRTELSLAKQEYIPDFKFGLEYVTGPVDGFRGWTITAGITLPFAPWTLGKASARVGEANATIKRSEAQYNASKNMVLSNVKDFYYKIEAGKRQLDTYRTSILPQARQSLNASQAAYQTGKTDFLMLIDSYRTLVDLTKEYFMLRMTYEQTTAELEREVGAHNIFYTK